MENIKNKLPYLILISLGIVIVFFFYGKVLLSPNNYMFSSKGDGIKNYFTYAYHIKHNASLTNFEGMNYPYGESYLYTDCHPVFASTFKFLSPVFPFLETHAVGVLNLIMILSIFFTFLIVYLLLVELKLNKWISILFSISITLLAPQIFRLGGHLALSYSVAIPLSWYLILKAINNPRGYYFVLLLLNNLFWMLIHAYLGIIVISFLFSILVVKILTDKPKRDYLFSYIWLGTAIIAPLIIFYSFTIIADTHVGRTNNPSGFFLYNAEFDDILMPYGDPFRPLLDKLTGGVIKLEWEARGYIGMVNAILFIALLIIALVSIFKRSTRALLKNIFDNRLLNISLIAASIVLLFALAIPFKQFPDLLEVFPVFKQFRATGRFVWPFYFAFTIFAAYIFQKKVILKFIDKKKTIPGIVILVLVTAVSCLEGYHYHYDISKRISKNPNVFNTYLLAGDFQKAIDRIDPDDYQAIISLPFYYQGSESYGRPIVDEAVLSSLIFSYHTGLPGVCANLTRTSVEESKRIVQIISPNYYEKKIVNDFPDKKAFLIVKTGDNLSQYERAISNKGESIFKTDKFELLTISFEQLFSDDKNTVLSDFNERRPDLLKQESFYVSDSSSALYYNSFENSRSDTSFRGQGSFSSIKKGKNVFAEFPPNTFDEGKEYDLSMWMYNGEPDALNLWFRLIVEEYDETNDQWYESTFFPEKAEVIFDNWSLVEAVFKVKDPNNRIYIVSKGKDNSKASLHVDDILIKEKGIDIYMLYKNDKSLFFNNHYLNFR